MRVIRCVLVFYICSFLASAFKGIVVRNQVASRSNTGNMLRTPTLQPLRMGAMPQAELDAVYSDLMEKMKVKNAANRQVVSEETTTTTSTSTSSSTVTSTDPSQIQAMTKDTSTKYTTNVAVPDSNLYNSQNIATSSFGFDFSPLTIAGLLFVLVPLVLTSAKKADKEAEKKLQEVRDLEAAEAREKKMRYEKELALAVEAQKKAEEAKVSPNVFFFSIF